MNKVLNRPMFRQTALRKGHLTPVHANTGIMIGQPYGPPTGAGVPSTQIAPWYKRLYADFKNSRQGIQQVLKGHKGANPLGSGRWLPAMVGMEGVYDLTSRFTGSPYFKPSGKGMEPGLAKTATDMGITGALTMNPWTGPVARGVGLGWTGAKLGKKYLYDPAKNWLSGMPAGDLDTKWGIEEGQKMVDLSEKEQPKTAIQIKKEVENIGPKRKHNRIGFDNKLTQTDNESKVVDGAVDVNKVIDNNIASMVPEGGGVDASKSTYGKPKSNYPEDEQLIAVSDKKKITNKDANLNVVKKANAVELDKEGEVKSGDGTSVTDRKIERAKQIRKELMAGKSSQAGLVFLANLASGLLSGTTAKAGIGGALEVFGKALGPAVNNYATIKLKENELENEFMTDALEMAADEIAAQNDLVEDTSGLDFENFGYIQFRDKNGRAINRTGGLLKDGTYVMAALGQNDANGRQVYIPVPAGTFSNYITSKFALKEQGQTLRNLSGKYKALGIGKETIGILEDAAAKGKTLGGPVGRLNLITTRLGSAFDDLGISMFGSKESGVAEVNKMREKFKSELMLDGLSEGEADKFLDDNFGTVDSSFEKIMKEMNMFKDETTAANLERLAINETVLTYALANSLKDKDRLTQKDIQMAQKLVNVFPYFRGRKQVVRSLEAVNERILGDIRASEINYEEFGGNTATLENFRKQYGLIPQMEGDDLNVGFDEDTTIDLMEKLNENWTL